MAEVKDKVITAESLKVVHDYGKSNYIKGIQKNGTDLTIDTNRKVNVLVPILDTSDNTASISSTSSSVNLGWLKNENSKKFAPKTFASQVIISSGNVLSDKLSSIDNTISDNYNIAGGRVSQLLTHVNVIGTDIDDYVYFGSKSIYQYIVDPNEEIKLTFILPDLSIYSYPSIIFFSNVKHIKVYLDDVLLYAQETLQT